MKGSEIIMYALQIGLLGLLAWLGVSLFRWNLILTEARATMKEIADDFCAEIEARQMKNAEAA